MGWCGISRIAPEYVAARRVLLDALTALHGHAESLILVGAQAVYHHTGDADLTVPIMTSDADLAIDVTDLAEVPEIGEVLRKAGFAPGDNPGHWVALNQVAIDLMVVPHQSGRTRNSARAARLATHDKHTARIVRGLEPALVDNARAVLASLDSSDSRLVEVRVSGPAALLTAKAIKISERLGQADRRPHRVKQKDALDAFRLFQAIDTSDLVEGFRSHSREEHAAAASVEALDLYRLHATSPQGTFAVLATQAAQGDPTVAPAFAALASQLLAALRRG